MNDLHSPWDEDGRGNGVVVQGEAPPRQAEVGTPGAAAKTIPIPPRLEVKSLWALELIDEGEIKAANAREIASDFNTHPHEILISATREEIERIVTCLRQGLR